MVDTGGIAPPAAGVRGWETMKKIFMQNPAFWCILGWKKIPSFFNTVF
jgi:hypothetical protein